MRKWIACLALGLVGLAAWAWLSLSRVAESPAAAAPTATHAAPEAPNAQGAAVDERSERSPLAQPERPTPPAHVAADDGAFPGAGPGGEDSAGLPDDAAFARKYAGFGAVELEAALDALGQSWHAARGAAIDAALSAGKYTATVVAPAELDAELKKLTDAATRAGDLFTSRTVPYGQGVMLELQFVRVARADQPALFATGDEVRWLENALEHTRREDLER